MTTDEEQREAAALLREYANYDFGDSDPWQSAMKAAFGDVAPHGEAETFARLADLIEPEPRSEDDAACESWIERTDSLEAVARDMLIFLGNDEGVFCEHCVGNGEGCCGEYLCATMAEARNNFLARLEALGVKP